MKSISTKKQSNILGLIKSLFISILITLICILIFAFILNIFNLGNESIDVVNQIIKILSIVIGLTFLKKFTNNKSVISFIIFGALYTIVTFLIFSALNQSFYIDVTLFNDAFFATLTCCIYFFLFAKHKN